MASGTLAVAGGACYTSHPHRDVQRWRGPKPTPQSQHPTCWLGGLGGVGGRGHTCMCATCNADTVLCCVVLCLVQHAATPPPPPRPGRLSRLHLAGDLHGPFHAALLPLPSPLPDRAILARLACTHHALSLAVTLVDGAAQQQCCPTGPAGGGRHTLTASGDCRPNSTHLCDTRSRRPHMHPTSQS